VSMIMVSLIVGAVVSLSIKIEADLFLERFVEMSVLFVEIRICWRRSGRRDVGDVGFGAGVIGGMLLLVRGEEG
jgi:hypothetical protein